MNKNTERKIFHINLIRVFNPKTGWFVAEDADQNQTITGLAILPPYGRVDCDCYQTTHSRFGPQWRVEKIYYGNIGSLVEPLLASGYLTHIRAAKIANQDDVYTRLEQQRSRRCSGKSSLQL